MVVSLLVLEVLEDTADGSLEGVPSSKIDSELVLLMRGSSVDISDFAVLSEHCCALESSEVSLAEGTSAVSLDISSIAWSISLTGHSSVFPDSSLNDFDSLLDSSTAMTES